MSQHGKKYREASKLVDESKAYSPEEAIQLAKKAVYAKFDETVELHLRMGVDPRAADQQVRGVIALPHGLGKKTKMLVFTQGEAVKLAQEAGADYVGADELVKQIESGWLDFDVALATPDMMSKVAKLGRILGRRGLMPNPKSGTVVPPQDLPRAISEARKGRAEFRLDRTGIIHLPIGKISFDENRLLENLVAVIEAITKAKPSGAKGQYIKSAFLSSTMGPGLRLDLGSLLS
ncbi:MAG: 50S ribosomal protein L1 [Chloroflexi bacterium CG_4_9_14_3_um_filter_45_9]|nr:MAG: 50S ribosomal protein L1 [Dehalococcoidia bacterium CG2_30_46_9]PIU23881.1 MAG: 50S ribosomal protein L1 [Chloroflexi bacterium CG08_land_8_20_14_0_20_45_12]PJB51114.1 MAG: 50S ribosomal protein L1 [Chloroflexi bacterium CG_4_9_14_3_um_filter_45_9]